ncbi:hypothetical protein H6G74_07370 [Nostoc spongiaeforme FACHB-130]|uniref:Uncharacterized protein n=1 Tax=Nostoc spongiaeforme FACHB-130 TaxID=1357510 RepID=A0ABR8FRU4_9NOSO|nr:hypothetical protein [Nostoc spongiaeforme]MBD2594150.1 hypothetical protein [Nostoc spongiaeforme FACHB-130]
MVIFSYRNGSRYSLLLSTIVCGGLEIGNSEDLSIYDLPPAMGIICKNTILANFITSNALNNQQCQSQKVEMQNESRFDSDS